VIPQSHQMQLPPEYGSPNKLLDWAEVDEQLRNAGQYWVASVRPDGRPHVVPRDGIWLDGTWHYGGSEATVHNRNLTLNRSLTMHIGDGMTAIIVEGKAQFGKAGPSIAQRLADEQNRKYSHYGMKATPEQYTSMEAWSLRATRVLAWTNLPVNATRFTFS
jgi:hypothetical protein